jgi:hypothetical protein
MIFFRFIKRTKNGLYRTNTYTRMVPINKLEYIDYDHYTNKMHFYFDGYSIDVDGSKDEMDSLKLQIDNKFDIIDIKED